MKSCLFFLCLTALMACQSPATSQAPGDLYPIAECGLMGYMDSEGEVVIPLQFHAGSEFSEGLAVVRKGGLFGYIDRSGSFVIEPSFEYAMPFSEGFAVAYQDAKPFFIKKDGRKAFDGGFKLLGDFREGRALVVTGTDKVGWVDTLGRLACDTVFSRISPIHNGKAVVEGLEHRFYGDKKDWQVAVIDLQGKFVVPYGKIQDYDDYFTDTFLPETRKEVMVSALEAFPNSEGEKKLKPVWKDDRLYYTDAKGKVVWKFKPAKQCEPYPLNIDYLNRGYFQAHSGIEEETAGGFAVSPNHPKMWSGPLPSSAGTLLVLVSEKAEPNPERLMEKEVSLLNNTGKGLLFRAQDSRLYMKVQALDEQGNWRDIEYLPRSWCGNSYHVVTLEPGAYWSFKTPVYEGSFKTKLRIEVEVVDPADTSDNRAWDGKVVRVYSEEYEGSVNPAQFCRKLGYSPHGIMDPYDD